MRKSIHAVDVTVRRLEETAQARAIKWFAIIDHSGEAARVGLPMPNTQLVIFGDPKAGAPIMIAPGATLNLQLRFLCPRTTQAAFGCPTTPQTTFRIDMVCQRP